MDEDGLKLLEDAIPELQGLTFPLDESKLEEIIQAIKAKEDLPRRTRIEPPRFGGHASALSRHKGIQQFIESFEYNYTGENFFNVKGVKQNQSLFRVIEVAKRVIKESLPIKCVEAVYLGIYLTQNMHDIERLPIIFNSEIDGHKYGHIVLLLRYNGKIGAVGLSRRADLMNKAWGFQDLSSVILDYKNSYQRWSHKLNKIKIGTPIPHEGSNKVSQVVDWSHTIISVKGSSWEEVDSALHKTGRSLGWEPRQVNPPPVKPKKEEAAKEPQEVSKEHKASTAPNGKKKPAVSVSDGTAATEGISKTAKKEAYAGEAAEVVDDEDQHEEDEPPRPSFLGV
mmetsp:Transcript_1926/g.4503  ORF Transcript_1926/g.4503 Transcript_1926/m.4503 type:complete len:339 (+) Transcript_1926:2-1018(+)